MYTIQHNLARLISIAFACACTVLALLWPKWSAALHEQGYYGAEPEPSNGSFETGSLFPWAGSGDVDVGDVNVLSGYWSAFLGTGDFGSLSTTPAVGDMCSYLESPPVYPTYDSGLTEVFFQVQYNTNESLGFFADPFHAQLKVPQGSVDLLTINTDGVFWSSNRGRVETQVIDYDAGRLLDNPPVMPPFVQQDGLFELKSHTLLVRSKVLLRGCQPVRVRFQICDWWDTRVDSAAFVDDVTIVFKQNFRSHECPMPIGFSAEKMDAYPADRN